MSRVVPRVFIQLMLAAALLVAGACSPGTPSMAELKDRGVFLLPQPLNLEPFALTTGGGEPFTNDNLMGGWSFIFFGFTNCPDICPTSLAVMAQAERQLVARGALQTPFRGVLISVDPERDQGSRLTEYVTAFSPSFTGVTGQRERVIQFAQQVHVARPMKVRLPGGDYTVDHPGQIVIVNPAGQYHGFIKQSGTHQGHSAETIAATFTALRAGS